MASTKRRADGPPGGRSNQRGLKETRTTKRKRSPVIRRMLGRRATEKGIVEYDVELHHHFRVWTEWMPAGRIQRRAVAGYEAALAAQEAAAAAEAQVSDNRADGENANQNTAVRPVVDLTGGDAIDSTGDDDEALAGPALNTAPVVYESIDRLNEGASRDKGKGRAETSDHTPQIVPTRNTPLGPILPDPTPLDAALPGNAHPPNAYVPVASDNIWGLVDYDRNGTMLVRRDLEGRGVHLPSGPVITTGTNIPRGNGYPDIFFEAPDRPISPAFDFNGTGPEIEWIDPAPPVTLTTTTGETCPVYEYKLERKRVHFDGDVTMEDSDS